MSRRDKNKEFLLGVSFLLSSLTMTGVANAACTPTPDCASIGYTETSCEGASLKCPFDITKMKCMPCDSSFRYDCAGANVTGGVGNTCNGKYASCECAGGFSFNNGECECPASITAVDCTVGTIYYPDGKCSNDYVACLNPVGIVVKDNALITALNVPDITWSSSYTNVSGITETTDSSVAKQDYNGKANTLAILEAYPSDTTSNNAAVFCYNYAPVGLESSKNQWYLPAMGELYDYIYSQYSTVKAGWDKVGTTISDSYFWSSSEYNSLSAWYVSSSSGSVDYPYKLSNKSVSCLLAL